MQSMLDWKVGWASAVSDHGWLLAGQAAGGGTLEGARLRLTLDIGRERNTWMPQTWAASGRRLEIPAAVEMQPGGIVMPLGVAAFIKLEVPLAVHKHLSRDLASGRYRRAVMGRRSRLLGRACTPCWRCRSARASGELRAARCASG